MAYRLGFDPNMVQRLRDGAWLQAVDPEYQRWLAEGNEPLPGPPPVESQPWLSKSVIIARFSDGEVIPFRNAVEALRASDDPHVVRAMLMWEYATENRVHRTNEQIKVFLTAVFGQIYGENPEMIALRVTTILAPEDQPFRPPVFQRPGGPPFTPPGHGGTPPGQGGTPPGPQGR